MTDTIAIIDCDIIAYRAAAANETRSVRVTHKVSGQVTEHAHRTAFRAHIKDVFEESEFDVEDVQTPEHIKHAIHGMKSTLFNILEKCGTDKFELYLSGQNNFRDSLPLPTKYKSGRSGGMRPVQLKECREYLHKHHGAVIVDNYEVDDKLAMRCWEGLQQGIKTIAVTNDGDQLGVSGWTFNHTKNDPPRLIKGLGEIHLNDKRNDFDGHGRKFFYAQWVFGDWNTDTFKPAELSGKKFGVVAMYELLKDCNTDKECIEAVYSQYKKWYPEPVTYTAWDGKEYTKDVIEIMDMYAACAWMRRWENDVFDTRKLLEKLEIAYG